MLSGQAEKPSLSSNLKTIPKRPDVMREIVIASLKTGAAPEKIYATIKTGRMVTKDNMKSMKPQ